MVKELPALGCYMIMICNDVTCARMPVIKRKTSQVQFKSNEHSHKSDPHKNTQTLFHKNATCMRHASVIW